MAKVKKVQVKTRLDRAQQFYLLNNPDGLTNEKMAEVLDVSVKTVYNYLKKNKPETKVAVEEVKSVEPEVKSPIPEGPKFDDLMGKAKHNRNPNAVVGAIMTPAASELADAHKKIHKVTMSEAMKAAIHQPKRKN